MVVKRVDRDGTYTPAEAFVAKSLSWGVPKRKDGSHDTDWVLLLVEGPMETMPIVLPHHALPSIVEAAAHMIVVTGEYRARSLAGDRPQDTQSEEDSDAQNH